MMERRQRKRIRRLPQAGNLNLMQIPAIVITLGEDAKEEPVPLQHPSRRSSANPGSPDS